MLRRHNLASRFLVSSSSSVACGAFRFNSSTATGEDKAKIAKLEALARQRQAEAEAAKPRSFERGMPNSPTPEQVAAASKKTSENPSSSTSNNPLRPERTRDKRFYDEAPPPNLDPKIRERISEMEKSFKSNQNSQDQPPSNPLKAERTKDGQQAQAQAGEAESKSATKHQSPQEPVPGSPMSVQGGSTIVFDVPEGELPQQATYDPWAILGLKPGASNHDLRVRYHELLEQYHPEYVKDGGGGDVQKWAEVDRAYQLVTKAPAHDKRYRNLMTDAQHFYYRYLPMWMARNIDEMPRWWSWMRWKLPTFWFVASCFGVMYIMGKVYAYYPNVGVAGTVCFITDILFHTSTFPVMVAVMFVMLLFSSGNVDMAWLTSPKGFLRRPLQY